MEARRGSYMIYLERVGIFFRKVSQGIIQTFSGGRPKDAYYDRSSAFGLNYRFD